MKKSQWVWTHIGDRHLAIDKFNSLWQLDPVTQCHNWTGLVNNAGYGFIAYYNIQLKRYRMMTAHRAALMIKLNRSIQKGMNANHTVCHNRLCVNPAHIEEGTQQEKLQAMRSASLIHPRTGALHPGAYLHQQRNRQYRYSTDDIQWIRSAEPGVIAQRYGITRARAHNMRWAFRNGYRWLPYTPV